MGTFLISLGSSISKTNFALYVVKPLPTPHKPHIYRPSEKDTPQNKVDLSQTPTQTYFVKNKTKNAFAAWTLIGASLLKHFIDTSESIQLYTFPSSDILVMVLAILTGVFGALAVILLVLLIVQCQKQRYRGKDYEEAIHM